jgi:L-asparaginase
VNSKPTVAIVFTGGTIASRIDEAFGGIVPQLSGAEILDTVPGIKESFHIEVCEYGRFPGPHITPEKMLEISGVVQGLLQKPDVSGVVVTHGTDTLEETAYFLDCTIRSSKPVVVVGAMRNSSEPDWDGPRNLRDAIALAAHKSAHDIGVVVCLAGTINAASEVAKTDTEEVNTFRSFDFGSIGRITNNEVFIYRKAVHREQFALQRLPEHVPLLKCYAGMDGSFVRAAANMGAEGLVLEAMGVGNVPPPVFYAVTDLVKNGIPVVLVSRCPVGRTEHVYAYEGAGKHLYDSGVIFADFLNGQKARIKLMCAIGAGMNVEQIRSSFQWMA